MTEELKTKKPRSFLWHVHYFRAFAVMAVVILHSWVVPMPHRDRDYAQSINHIRELLFHDSSIFFILISGFLFHHLSVKFSWSKHVVAKLSFVVCPYLFITSLVFAWGYVRGTSETLGGWSTYGEWILSGKAQIQFWYMPFICIVYAFSPFLLSLSRDVLKRLVVLSFILPLLGTREGISPFGGTLLYFLPIFVIGYGISAFYIFWFRWIEKSHGLLLTMILLSTTWLVYSLWWDVEPRWGICQLRESVFYIQKLAISLLAIHLLQRLPERIFLLDRMARASFGMYFLHTFIQGDSIKYRMYDFFGSRAPWLLLPASLIFVFLVLIACWITVEVLAKILGKYSRYLIGY